MTPEQLRNFYSHGSPDPLPETVPLRAGPLAMIFDSRDLRYIKLGEREVLRRIYAAVRDHNWGTVPGVISNLKQKITDNSFRIQYDCEHRQNDIHFVWRSEIVGDADGSILFSFDGETKSTFLRNRIGFCVLHPIGCAGAKCRAVYADGSQKESVFPEIIAAEQPVTSLHDLAGLDHEIEPEVWAELRFEGDLFETEDQRNWIDASFKTFCTPLRLPFPVEIKAGTRIRQEVHLKLTGATRIPENVEVTKPIHITTHPPATATLSVSSPRPLQNVRALPAIGLCWPSQVQALAASETGRLTALNLTHLRVDVRMSNQTALTQLTTACADSKQLGTQIELAVHLDNVGSGDSGGFLATLRSHLEKTCCRVSRILAFGASADDSTPPAVLGAMRSIFGGRVLIGAGTNADLYQLNLQRPPADADFICWSMNPQVHAFDCSSIAETPKAAAQQVTSVREYYPDKPLVVSPITLKPRFNPVATGPEQAVSVGELPPDVDPRQLSLFGAAWTLAMIKAVAEAGADSVTLYETVGRRGVMETETGSTCPEKFPSIPGTVFPLYHVLADVGEFAGGSVVLTESSDPLAIASLLLQKDKRSRLIVANLTGHPQNVLLETLARNAHVRTMDLSNVHSATTKPEDFRGSAREFSGTTIRLEAHAVASIDSTHD